LSTHRSEQILAVRRALQPVIDPELGVSIVDLGLIRGIDVHGDDDQVLVHLTLTSPMCPMGPQIMASVENAVSAIPWQGGVDIQLVWQPPWDPHIDATDEVKADLGIWL
jgi:metal-sulfur cluster biosynthetic enzyme